MLFAALNWDAASFVFTHVIMLTKSTDCQQEAQEVTSNTFSFLGM